MNSSDVGTYPDYDRDSGEVAMRTPVRLSLQDGFDLAGIDIRELWWRYAALGGQAGPSLLGRRITAAEPVSESEHNLIAQALNEHFADWGIDTFPVGYGGTAPF